MLFHIIYIRNLLTMLNIVKQGLFSQGQIFRPNDFSLIYNEVQI